MKLLTVGILGIVILIAGTFYFLNHGYVYAYIPNWDVPPRSVELPKCTVQQVDNLAVIPSLQQQANAANAQVNTINVEYLNDIEANWVGAAASKATYESLVQPLNNQASDLESQIISIKNANYCAV